MPIVEIIRNAVEVVDVLRMPPRTMEVYLRRGEQGESGVIAVNAPIVNSGDASNANLSLSIDGNLQVVAGALKVTDTLTSIDKIAFDTAAGAVAGVGQFVWNDTDGTLDLGLKGGNVTLQVGQESVQLVKHADNIGLVNGSAVYLTGSDGNNITVRYAQASSEPTSSKTFGIMTEDATGGGKAFCTTFGLVRNINTSHLTEGAIIWLSSSVAGGLTTTKPTAPNHGVALGLCVRSHATQGVVFVSVSNGQEIDELHDVAISSPTNNQVLVYNGTTGLWTNQNISVLFDDLPAFYLLFENGLV